MVPVLASPGVLRVTRVLCSAVYVDNDFAGQAAFLWRRRDLRAVAPSVGIDLRPLLRHSLAALRSKRIYRRRLLGILLVACALVVTLVPLVVGGLVGRACVPRPNDQLRRRRSAANDLVRESILAAGPDLIRSPIEPRGGAEYSISVRPGGNARDDGYGALPDLRLWRHPIRPRVGRR